MQRLKTAVKRMAAIGAGVAMTGATMMGAVAQSMNDIGAYPYPFVDQGNFDSDTALVVGANAAASDTLGAVDIARQIQFDSKVCVPSSSAAGGVTVSGDAYEIGSPSDLLELRESIGSVRETLTEVELDGLQGGLVTTNEGTTEFNQYLRFSRLNASGQDTIIAPQANFTSNDGPTDEVGDWLFIPEGSAANAAFFEYELEFEDGLESDIVSKKLDDLEDEEVIALGTTYTFVDTSINTATDDITVELLGGAVYDILEEGEEKTYTVDGKEYKIEVLIIEDTTPATVTFNINGEVTDQLVDGETEILKDGTLIGISDIILNEAGEAGLGDIVELYLGATKLELRDTNYSDSERDDSTALGFHQGVEIDEETIEDAFVQIKGNELNSGEKFEIISIKYRLTADALPGYKDVHVAPGKGVREYLDEPQGMLGLEWDLRYEGLDDVGVSVIKLDPQGDDEYTLEFENRQGAVYKIPYVTNEAGTFKYGDDDDDLVFVEANFSEAHTGGGDANGLAHNNQSFNIGIHDYFVLSETSKNTSGNPSIGTSTPGITGTNNEEHSGGLDDTSITHIVRYNSIDTSDQTLSFDDEATGSKEFTYETIAVPTSSVVGRADLIFSGNTYATYVANVTQNGGDNPLAIDMDADGSIDREAVRITVNGGGILKLGVPHESDGGNYTIGSHSVATWTNTGDTITALDFHGGVTLNLTTLSEDFDENKPASSSATGSVNEELSFTIQTRTNNEIGVNKSSFSIEIEEPDDDDDNSYGMTDYGVHVNLFDPSGSTESETITVQYPLAQRGARVFVVMGDTTTTKTSSGEVCTVANIQLNNLLDSEVRDPTDHHLLLVGGPCANDVVADVFMSCSEWSYSAGQGVIQMVDNGNNVAMLVAGTNAADTRLAAKVLANYENYAADLAGKDMVTVSGSSISSVTLA